MTRPTSNLANWASTGTIVEPSAGQKNAGFAPSDRPPAQWFNYVFSNLAQWAAYLDERPRDDDQAMASLPLIGTSLGPDDHPSSPRTSGS